MIKRLFGKLKWKNKIKPFILKEHGCLQYEMSRVSGSKVKFVLIRISLSNESLALHDIPMILQDAKLQAL